MQGMSREIQPPEDPAPPAQRGRDETRRRILEAALELFARDGFDDTTVRAVAARSGVTDAAVFYYFPSKRSLLDALWTIRPERNLRTLEPGPAMTPARLREIIDETLDFVADNHDVLRLMSYEALSGDKTASALRQESRALWRRAIHAHFAAAFDADTADRATDILHALIHGVTMRAIMDHGDRAAEIFRERAFREQLWQRAALVVPLSGMEPAR
ncbi:MAG: hypothetical protein AMXMBFR80_11730 [Dehalococcoidia bacterium]